MTANKYGCPAHIYSAMKDHPKLPLFSAVLSIKPGRVKWVGQPSGRKLGVFETCWSLDGRRTTHADMMREAGLPESYGAGTNGWVKRNGNI
jgi:hypothetical protein